MLMLQLSLLRHFCLHCVSKIFVQLSSQLAQINGSYKTQPQSTATSLCSFWSKDLACQAVFKLSLCIQQLHTGRTNSSIPCQPLLYKHTKSVFYFVDRVTAKQFNAAYARPTMFYIPLVIGASMSEPHTIVSRIADFSYICVHIYLPYVFHMSWEIVI